jgi:hypothetical protein
LTGTVRLNALKKLGWSTDPGVSAHKEHFDISEGSNSLVQQRHAVTSFFIKPVEKKQRSE